MWIEKQSQFSAHASIRLLCKGRLSRQRHFDRINLGWKEEGGKSRRIGFRITFSDKATPYSTSTKFKSRYPFLCIIAVVDRNSSQKLSYSAQCLKITDKYHLKTFRAKRANLYFCLFIDDLSPFLSREVNAE